MICIKSLVVRIEHIIKTAQLIPGPGCIAISGVSPPWTWDQCLSRVAAIKSLYDFKRTDAVWIPLLSSLIKLLS